MNWMIYVENGNPNDRRVFFRETEAKALVFAEHTWGLNPNLDITVSEIEIKKQYSFNQTWEEQTELLDEKTTRKAGLQKFTRM